MDEDSPSFSSPDEEIKYWREQSQLQRQKAQDTQDEFDEFQENSRELEMELEIQLKQAEKEISDLKFSKLRAEQEVDGLKEKLDALNHENFITISTLEEEASTLMQHREILQKYVRELEQTNDDLERAKRNTVQSLDDFERKLNQEMERNALLEHELDEKESLHTMVQRLKDETRDLRHELALRPKVVIGEVTPGSSILNVEEIGRESSAASAVASMNVSTTSINSLRGAEEAPTGAAVGNSPAVSTAESMHLSLPTGRPILERTDRKKATTHVHNTPLPPTTRLSALTIVSDLLRKVGLLESKLANARNIQAQQSSPMTFAAPSDLRTKSSLLHNGTVEALRG